MFKPTGRNLKAYEAGKQAFRHKKLFTDNPNLNGPNVVMSSWWEKGYREEQDKFIEII